MNLMNEQNDICLFDCTSRSSSSFLLEKTSFNKFLPRISLIRKIDGKKDFFHSTNRQQVDQCSFFMAIIMNDDDDHGS